MNKEIEERRTQWAAALRSGKYKQGQNVLQNHSGEFCCLGVACDLFDPTKWSDLRYCERRRLPPSLIGNYFGIDEIEVDTLAKLNDTGYDFEYIANYIEQMV